MNQASNYQNAPQHSVDGVYRGTDARPVVPASLNSLSSSDDPSSMEFILNGRDTNAFKRASAHSWLVQFLKVFFPIMGVFLVLAIVAAYVLANNNVPSLKIEETSFVDNKIVMKNPELKGVDKEQRPYALNAAEAIQNPKNPSVVELKQIDAKVPMQEGVYANVIAGTGVYDSSNKTLKLNDQVNVTTESGMSINLQNADVDMNAGTLTTNNPVSMRSSQAEISANGFVVEENGATITFNERVKMIIYPEKFKSNQQ